MTTLLRASTPEIPCSAFHRYYWSLSIKRQRGGWLGFAHPKTLARPASAAANRFAILGIHRPVLDAGLNDDHPAFQQCECRGRRGGGRGAERSFYYLSYTTKILCRSGLRAISNNYVNTLIISKGECKNTTLQFVSTILGICLWNFQVTSLKYIFFEMCKKSIFVSSKTV